MIAFASFVALAACSLADFTGFTEGDETPDGGSSDAPAASTDGGDSSTTTPADGGTDAPADASSDAATFCETNADAGFFCEDFEGPNPLSNFDITKTIGGTLAVVDGTLIADVPAGASAAYVSATTSPGGTPGSSARLSLSVEPLLLNTTTNNACQVAKIYFFGAQNTATYEVGVGIHGSESSELYAYEYTEGGGYKEFGDLPPLAPSKMTRLVLEVRIDTAGPQGARVNLYRDGVRVVTDGVLTPPRTSGRIEGFIGVPFAPANHGTWKVRIDDVVMGLLP